VYTAGEVISRIAESFKATFKFDGATATKFLMNPLFGGCTNWPRLERVRARSARPECPQLQ
jgi:hypothetical protein